MRSPGVLVGSAATFAPRATHLLNDPRTCVNCHVMRDQHDAWQNSSHHAVRLQMTAIAVMPKLGEGQWMRHSACSTLGTSTSRSYHRKQPAGGRATVCHEHLASSIRGDGSPIVSPAIPVSATRIERSREREPDSRLPLRRTTPHDCRWAAPQHRQEAGSATASWLC